MARKKDRAFFICPRWRELASDSDDGALARALRSHPRTIAKIAAQTPVAYATLRGVLSAVRGRSDLKLDVDSYIVDMRNAGR